MNTKELILLASELLPDTLEGDTASYENLIFDLLEFGIFDSLELKQIWRELELKVREKEKESWEVLKKANPSTLEQKKYPWTHNRVGIFRVLLEEKFGPLWLLHKARHDEYETQQIVKNYFSSPLPVRPHSMETFARLRSLDKTIHFFEKLELQFTSVHCFNDIFDAGRSPRYDFTLEHLIEELRTQVNDICFSQADPNLCFGTPVNMLVPVLLALREKAKKNKVSVQENLDSSELTSTPALLANMAFKELDAIKKHITSLLNSLKICCLTSEEALSRARIWEDFGDNHAGCAILFRASPVRRNIFWDAQPVHYGIDPPSIVSAKEWAMHVTGRKRINLLNRVINHLTFKMTDYTNEMEWRIFCPDPNARLHRDVMWTELHPSDVVAVIAGMQVSKENIAKLKTTVQSKLPHVEFFQSVPSHSHGRLTRVRCNI